MQESGASRLRLNRGTRQCPACARLPDFLVYFLRATETSIYTRQQKRSERDCILVDDCAYGCHPHASSVYGTPMGPSSSWSFRTAFILSCRHLSSDFAQLLHY